MRRHGKRDNIFSVRKIIIVIFWLLIWLLLALWVDNDIILASPQEAVISLLEKLIQKKFWEAVLGSLVRIALGFVTGFLTAVFLAILSSRFEYIEELLSPLMGLFKAVPVASFVVLFLIWWGSSFLAVAVSFLVVLPNVYVNTLGGIKNTDKKLLEMAEVFHISMKNKFFYIYRPAIKPFMISALKVSVGMSWKSGIAAEIIGTPSSSIGNGLYMSKIVLDTAGVFSWTTAVIILSFLCEKLVLWAAGIFFSMEPGCRGVKADKGFDPVQAADIKNIKSKNIVVKNIRKTYGEQDVLNGVNAVYESGGVYYLTSPSGSGKTTLLRIICGLEDADDGSVSGADRYSVVFQEDRLCEDYSAVKNVSIVTKDEEKAKEMLGRLLDEDALSKPCRELSGGMKRRVAVVRAMEAESECVLLDEPFTGMDAVTKDNVEKYIRDRQRGRVLIIATHI